MPGVLNRLLLAALLASPGMAAAAEQPEDLEFFEKKIRPVLVRHCHECHSAEAARSGKLKGRLQLDTREGIRAGGDSGPAVVPGKPTESLLLDALRYEAFEMPPEGMLPEQIVADFQHWIERGAADPRDGQSVDDKPALDLVKARQFWSLRPVRPSPPPEVSDPDWAANPIDRFVRAKLQEHRLEPAGLADKRSLLRRLSFDLIGLPPTPTELEAFLSDDSPEAYSRQVDRLLASPHFGERWGRHWLDLARFSESCGSTRNMVWHHAWRYRNYVIDAFNRDLPFDQFVREQIAGDLLPAESPEERDRQTVATGLLALGPKALDETKREVFRMDLIDEQIDVVSRVFLGLSVACARCHDHKFDPIPTRDYYALAGIFRSTETLYGAGPMGIRGVNDSPLQPIGPQAAELAAPAAEHFRRVQEQTQTRNTARSDRYRVVRKVADLKRQLEQPAAEKAPDKAALSAEIETLEAEIKRWDEKIAGLDKELNALVDQPPPQPDYAMAARDASQIENCRVHVRGETTNLGDSVPRGVLQVLPVEQAAIGADESGRRQLAEWLASPDNPLTARVAVNRVWQHLLGRGLVTTPDDFGTSGMRPSHPELLDHLAAGFMADGWSLKRLIRSLVLTRTYRLGSQVAEANQQIDPDNVWLWRRRPRRLEAEAFRDAILATSGELETSSYSQSEVARLDPLKQPEFNFALALKPEQMEHAHRSVYLPIVRGNLPEMLKLFDFADPNRPVGQRDETIVPAQASFLMNSPWMIAQARRTAQRLLEEVPGDDVQRIERLYELAFARLPSEAEVNESLDFLGQRLELLPVASPAKGKPATRQPVVAEDPRLEPWTSLCHAVLASAEFRYVQ